MRLIKVSEKLYDKMVEMGYSSEMEITTGYTEFLRDAVLDCLDDVSGISREETEAMGKRYADNLLDYGGIIDYQYIETLVTQWVKDYKFSQETTKEGKYEEEEEEEKEGEDDRAIYSKWKWHDAYEKSKYKDDIDNMYDLIANYCKEHDIETSNDDRAEELVSAITKYVVKSESK